MHVPAPNQPSGQSIAKSDVPFVATPAGVTVLSVAMFVILLLMMLRRGFQPGVVEFSMGFVFGIPSGLLHAIRWRHSIIVRAIAKRTAAADSPLFQYVELILPHELLLWLAGLPIAIGLCATHFLLWRAMPGLTMPWARFNELVSFSLPYTPEPVALALALISQVATVLSFGIITWFMSAASMLLWYRGLSDHLGSGITAIGRDV